MATTTGITHQLRRGTSTQVAVFNGALAEPAFNTTTDKLVLYDGVTVGGRTVESASVQIVLGQPATILPSAAMVYVYSTVAVSVQLPSVLNYSTAQHLTIVDAGVNAASATITVNTASASELLVSTSGITSTTTTITVNGGLLRLMALNPSTAYPLRWVGMSRRT